MGENEAAIEKQVGDFMEDLGGGSAPPATPAAPAEPTAAPAAEPAPAAPAEPAAPAQPSPEPPAAAPVTPAVTPQASGQPLPPAPAPAVAVAAPAAAVPTPSSETVPKSEYDKLEKAVNEMRNAMAEMAKMSHAPAPAPAQPAPQQMTPGPPQPAPVSPVADVSYVTDDAHFDSVINKVEEFNKLLNKVKRDAIEATLMSVPTLATKLVDQQMTMRIAADEFYKINSDLIPYKSFCGYVTNELASKNPEMTLDKLLEEVGKEVRKRLAVSGTPVASAPSGPAAPGPAAPAAPAAPAGPAFVHPSAARSGPVPQPTVMSQGDQVADLIAGL